MSDRHFLPGTELAALNASIQRTAMLGVFGGVLFALVVVAAGLVANQGAQNIQHFINENQEP